MRKNRQREVFSPFEQELSNRLKDSPVPVVPWTEIDAAARTAALWCVPGRKPWSKGLWRAAMASVTAGAAPFWLLCAFLLGSSVAVGLLWSDLDTEPLAVLLPLAPVPFLCFLIRELQMRNAALVQLERCCVLSPSWVCFLRLWMGTLVNSLVVALSGAALGGEALQFYLCAFTVLFFLGAVALLLLSVGGGAMPLSLLLAVWTLGAFWLLSQREFFELIREISLPLWAGAVVAGLGLFTLTSLGVSRRLYV